MNKPLLDIKNLDDEFKLLNSRFKILHDRFMAVAIDYKYYIDSSWTDNKIYELRDDTTHRLFCSKLHIEILFRQINLIHHRIGEKLKVEPDFASRQFVGSNPLYDHFGNEISAIFDSIIFHSVASFDYLSNLCSFICNKNRDTKLKWSNLTSSVRDPKNVLFNSKIAQVVDEIDKEFVGKLYNHRSNIIHEKVDRSKYQVTVEYTPGEMNVIQTFLIGDDLIKKFNVLKELNKSNSISVTYASFWLLNLCIDKITDILFALKLNMESNPKIPHGAFVLLDENNRMVSPSRNYWHADDFNTTNK